MDDKTDVSRRALLAGAPAAAATALAGGTVANAVAISMAKAAEVDPIFEAIATRRQRAREQMACFRVVYKLEEEATRYGSWHWKVGEDGPPADCADHPEWIAAQMAIKSASDREEEATEALLATTPTGVPGVIALLDYLESPSFRMMTANLR